MSSGVVDLGTVFAASTVSSVSATAPLYSTGGSDPVISLFPFTAGSVIFSNGSQITQDNANFNWNDAADTLSLTLPSSGAGLASVLILTSDPSGAHGWGNHLEIAGNPGGGGTIFRTDGGLNNSALQIYGGDSSGNNSGQIYINGNNSTQGDAGGVQNVLGITGATFDVLAPSSLSYAPLFQVTGLGYSIFYGHLKSAQVPAPTVAVNGNAGTGASASLAHATDVAGALTLTTTATSPASGVQATVTFNGAYALAPLVQLTPANANAAQLAVSSGVYVSSTTTDFSINFANADAIGHTYIWNYQIIETL